MSQTEECPKRKNVPTEECAKRKNIPNEGMSQTHECPKPSQTNKCPKWTGGPYQVELYSVRGMEFSVSWVGERCMARWWERRSGGTTAKKNTICLCWLPIKPSVGAATRCLALLLGHKPITPYHVGRPLHDAYPVQRPALKINHSKQRYFRWTMFANVPGLNLTPMTHQRTVAYYTRTCFFYFFGGGTVADKILSDQHSFLLG